MLKSRETSSRQRLCLPRGSSVTINVVASTYDAVVLGCDSLSSVVERAYFPFRTGSEFAVDADGNRLVDREGNFVFAYRQDQLAYTATSVMGGVRKMFLILEDGPSCEFSVAAVTSGMATLNGVTIAQLGQKYRRKATAEGTVFTKVEEVLQSFLTYIRQLWELQVADVPVDLRAQYRLNFLAAGYCRDDEYTKVFRIDVTNATIVEQFTDNPHCGATWDGQSDFAARLIRGIDAGLQRKISKSIAETLQNQRMSILQGVMEALQTGGVTLPDGFTFTIQESVPPSLPFSAGEAEIDWPNLPVQSAIELVSALVNAESGMQKFARGIPMVGGRTRIGLLRRNMPFATLNEPDLSHTHLGYATDA